MRRVILKKKLKKGSGELFGFICISPIIMLLMLMLVSVAQVSSLKEKMAYTTYVACRAAVLAETKEEAEKSALEAAEKDLSRYSRSIQGDVEVKLNYASGSGHKWEKGNYITCVLKVKPATVSPLVKDKKIKCSMTMAIEKQD